MADKVDKGNAASQRKEKKPFDKKKWRERHHSKKYKVQKWEEERKKAMEHKYKRQLKKEGIVLSGTVARRQEEQKIGRIKQAQAEFERKKFEQNEAKQKQEERKRARKAMLEKKEERDKKLRRKTKRGQPMMGVRLELLQEKIERLVAENKI